MLTATRPSHRVTRNVQRFKLLSKQRPSNYVQGDSDLDLEYIYFDDPFSGNPDSTDNSNAYAENCKTYPIEHITDRRYYREEYH